MEGKQCSLGHSIDPWLLDAGSISKSSYSRSSRAYVDYVLSVLDCMMPPLTRVESEIDNGQMRANLALLMTLQVCVYRHPIPIHIGIGPMQICICAVLFMSPGQCGFSL